MFIQETLQQIVLVCYVLTLLFVLVAEITNNSRAARVAAYSALILSLTGGAAWSYAAYLQPYHSNTSWAAQSKLGGSGSQSAKMRAGYVGYSDEPADDQDAADTGAAGGRTTLTDAIASKSARARYAVQDMAVMAAIRFGLMKNTAISAVEPQTVKDCADCPELIVVAPGEQFVGADDDDTDATRAEKPKRLVRVWPGFAIGATAVTDASFQAFLKDTERSIPACNGKVETPTTQTTADALAAVSNGHARCVTTEQADAYVAWLSARTGKRFRLPTAIEWEFAMRQVVSPALVVGDTAEIVADCWQDQLPSAGLEAIASQTYAGCSNRMIKGASPTDLAKWHRPSARRLLQRDHAFADVGFRVLRVN